MALRDLLAPLLGSGQPGNGHAESSHGSVLEVITPCTEKRYYDKYELTGARLLGIVERAALNDSFDLTTVDLRSFESYLEATYQTYGPAENRIHAIHLAASLGSIRVMEWLRDSCSDDVLNKRATLTHHERPEQASYPPLMSALFMSQTDATLWLLRQGVSVSLTNTDGYTPLHLLAWTGLPHHDPEGRKQSLERVATTLFQKAADLSAQTNILAHRSDEEARQFSCKTPLEMAVKPASAFPKKMLHLLTKSFYYLDAPDVDVLKEVEIVAAEHPLDAETLVDKVQAQDSVGLKAALKRRMMRADAMDTFVNILEAAPPAGAKLLKLLLGTPQVRDPQRYPLPSRARIPNDLMRCTYQVGPERGPVWENGREAPSWHAEFQKGVPAGPRIYSQALEVKVKVLLVPGILNARVLGILSVLKSELPFLKLFAQVPVLGITTCMWQNSCNAFISYIVWELVTLLALLVLGIIRPPTDDPIAFFSRSVIAASIMVACFNLVWGLSICKQRAGLPVLKFMSNFERSEVLGVLGLIVLAIMGRFKHDEKVAHLRVAIAANVALRCSRLTLMLQVVPVLGPLIIAVRSSFMPMMGMFGFMMKVFTAFAFIFIILKDDERSVKYVLMYLYPMLMLGDRDSASAISGVDIGKEQTLDFHVEMYTGGDDNWLLGASAFFSFFGMSLFSIVLLNLTIGIYASYYEQMQPLAQLIFQQRRCRQCVAFMLMPAWQLALLIKRRWTALCAAAIILLICWLSVRNTLGEIICAFFLGVAVIVFQAVLLVDAARMTQKNGYLWICHRADYHEECYRSETDMYEVCLLRQEVEKMSAAQDAKLQDLARQLDKTNQNLQRLMEKLQEKPPG